MTGEAEVKSETPTRVVLDIEDINGPFGEELAAAYSDRRKYTIATSIVEKTPVDHSFNGFWGGFTSRSTPVVSTPEGGDADADAGVVVVVRRDSDSATHQLLQQYLAELSEMNRDTDRSLPAKVHFVVVCNSAVAGSVFEQYDTSRIITGPTKRLRNPIERKLKQLKTAGATETSSDSSIPKRKGKGKPAVVPVTTSFVSVVDTQEQLFRFIRQSVVDKLTEAVDDGAITTAGTVVTVNDILGDISKSMNEDYQRMRDLI